MLHRSNHEEINEKPYQTTYYRFIFSWSHLLLPLLRHLVKSQVQ